MQPLKKLYRSNYAGETIISTLTYIGGERTSEIEYIPNQIFDTKRTTHAVAIGNGESRRDFNLEFVVNHRGATIAEKLQSYGCNALYRDYTPDFLIATGNEIVKEIVNSGYTENNIVYAHADAVLKYPGKFYLIPQNLSYDSGSTAAYMAAFDGHTKVYLIGYDQYDNHHQNDGDNYNNIYKDTPGYLTSEHTQNAKFFSLALEQVITTYNDVEFVRVMPLSSWWTPPVLLSLPNFRQISFQEFINEADLGSIGLPGIES